MKGGHTKEEANGITIQDIVCLPPAPNDDEKIPRGEYDNKKADEANQTDRIYATLQMLINMAAEEHITKNCNKDKKLKRECKNNITRLLTSEFFFYTKKPLTIPEFSQLQTNIAELAAKQPKNLHLILGSFAVKTANNELLSVVPYIQCGPNVKINLILKNFFAEGDPLYSEKKNNKDIAIKNVEIQIKQDDVGKKSKDDKIEAKKASISGKKRAFSFNNVLICKTAGKAKFSSCVDICLDHERRIAKTRLENRLNKKLKNPLKRTTFPIHCSHILISNTSNVLPSKRLVENIAHADPFHFPRNWQKNAGKGVMKQVNPPFGSTTNVYIVEPMACQLFMDSDIRQKIEDHNRGLWKGKKQKETSPLLQYTGPSSSDISAEALHSKPISEKKNTTLPTLLAKLEDTKNALEKEAAFQSEEDTIAPDPSTPSRSALQFTEKEKPENKVSNTATQQENTTNEAPSNTTGRNSPR